jgi:lysophospholipase L1-like esterase
MYLEMIFRREVTFAEIWSINAVPTGKIRNFMIQKTIQVLVMAVCVAFLGTARALDDAKPFNTFGHREVIRLVCIGDSITQADAYVSALRTALGSAWEVTNFGVSGATMLKTGDKPYNRLPQYGQAMQKKPDVATIMLGTNDSKPGNWVHKAEFEADYKAVIADLKKANPKVAIYCCVPPPAGGNKWGINGDIIKNEVQPMVRKVAKETGCYVVDLQEPFAGKNYTPDGVHPNVDGHKVMAAAIHKAVTGKPIPAEVLAH